MTGRLIAADREVIRQLVDRTLLESLRHEGRDLSWWHDVDLSWVPPRLTWHGASFVTLTRNGRLLGCIGTLEAHQPLVADIVEHTLAAAYRDPRFDHISADDVHALDFEVSVLTPLVGVNATSQADIAAVLRPGVDGLVISAPPRRGTLLPSVWDSITDPADFVAATWRKAGLSADDWPDNLEAYVYETEKIIGRGPR